MKITVEAVVKAKLNKVWDAWNNPADIKQWNTAQDDWHTTRSTVDLREGGKFLSRMEAKDGNEGFDFEGTYTRIVPHKTIEYRMSDMTNWSLKPDALRDLRRYSTAVIVNNQGGQVNLASEGGQQTNVVKKGKMKATKAHGNTAVGSRSLKAVR